VRKQVYVARANTAEGHLSSTLPSTNGGVTFCPPVGSCALLEVYLLKPLNEVVYQDSKSFLGLAIVKRALFVALYFLSNMPVDDELIRKDALVVHQLHKCVQELLLSSVPFYEVEHNRLQKPFDSDFTVALNKA